MNNTDLNQPFVIDEQSFAQLYQASWKKVFGVCYHILKDVETSKEIAQEIFESIWLRRDSLEIQGDPESYLVKAAKLKTFDHIRKVKVRSAHQQEEVALGAASANTTEEMVLHNDLLSQVNSALALLPARSRSVYQLEAEGIKRTEIAKKLNLSEKTVEYHLYRAVNFLKNRLQYEVYS